MAPTDDAERARAAEFAFEDDRRRFLAGRACLRKVLREYAVLGEGPARNLSHSGDLIAVAIGRRTVGIDVEQLRGVEPEAALVARACTPAQRRGLDRLPRDEREQAFLAQWVRKEALGKALGVGLDLALTGAPITVFPHARGRRHAGVWRVFDIETPDAYVGAVAGRGLATRVVVRRTV